MSKNLKQQFPFVHILITHSSFRVSSFLFRPPPSTFRLLFISIIFIIVINLSGCTPSPTPFPSYPPTPDPNANGITVYFTRSSGGAEALETALLADIAGAQETIDLAIYNINLDAVGAALSRAAQRGVHVRIVMETDNMDNRVPQQLMAQGISIIGDGAGSLMHDKFIIVDGEVLWTGSMNFTQTGLHSDDNNFVRFESPELAADYTTEFEEMFVSRQFDGNSPAGSPFPIVDLNGRAIEVYFSPDDGVEARLLQLIQEANTSIIFLANTFTSDDLSLAMIERFRAGVAVQGIFDDSMVASNQGSEYDRLRQAGTDVILDIRDALMHHKVIIFDDDIVVMGSYNFTRSAEERNDENLLVIHDPAIAALFLAEYNRILAEGR